MLSPSGLVPNLPDEVDGISPIAGLGSGGKYTEPGILLTVGPLRPWAWDWASKSLGPRAYPGMVRGSLEVLSVFCTY